MEDTSPPAAKINNFYYNSSSISVREQIFRFDSIFFLLSDLLLS